MIISILMNWLRRLHRFMLRFGIYPYLLLLGVTLAVWLPSGFNIGPYKMEGLALLRDHSGDHGILDPMVTRLFRDVPVWLGLHLVPHGFQGWQAMLLLLTLLRGVLIYLIVKGMLQGQRLFALLAGLLALFHPADAGYFYVNTSGEQFALVLSLAGCACAVSYLYSNRRLALAGIFLFELLAGFTYSGFLPLMVVLPAGAWMLKWVQEGKRPQWLYLVFIGVAPVILVITTLVFISHGVGRDSSVADFDVYGVMAGYWFAVGKIVSGFADLVKDLKSTYLVPLAIMTIMGISLGYYGGYDREAVQPDRSPRLTLVVVGGLLLLAAISYLPYSLSTVRFANNRQLLMAGVFGYSAVMFLVLTALGRHVRKPWITAIVIGVMTCAVTAAGLEKRVRLLDRYHAAESLLAAVATAVPNPASGSFILIQMQPEQIESVPGFANREGALTAALRFMYQDDSIEAGFIKAPGKHRVHFGADGVQTNLFFGRKHHGDNKVFASYDRLIVMGYVTNQSVHVFNKVWLQKQIEVQDISTAYDPEKLRDTGPHNSIACSMLEVDHRPAYCHSGVHHAEGIPSVL